MVLHHVRFLHNTSTCVVVYQLIWDPEILFLRGQRTYQSQETRHYIHLDRSLMTFNTLHREHIRGEIVWNVLKVRVILDEKLSRSYTCHTPHGGVLRQDHGLDQIEI